MVHEHRLSPRQNLDHLLIVCLQCCRTKPMLETTVATLQAI